jgi:SAM-dependent methyltransferase
VNFIGSSSAFVEAMGTVYVQYGCGLCAPEGWMNFDASPTLRARSVPVLGRLARRIVDFPSTAKYGDILAGLPVADKSADAVYCSHVLEHLSQEDCRRALANTFRILKPGGRFRLVMPDLRWLVDRYINDPTPDAAGKLMRETLLGEDKRPRGLMNVMREWVGNSRHRWMWDYPAMEHELRQVGFTDIRRASFGDSGDERFNAVEEERRWEGGLGVDCRRPQEGNGSPAGANASASSEKTV